MSTSPNTRILLLRHAQTADPSRFHGAESDVDLSDHGRQQAQAVAQVLAAFQPDAVYSSALLRARLTAEPIAHAAGQPLQLIPTLHERRMGRLSGLPREAYLADYQATMARWEAGDLHATDADAESYADIRERILPAFQQIAQSHPGQTAVVVAHGLVVRVALTSLTTNLNPTHFRRIPIQNCALNDLHAPPIGPWTLTALNWNGQSPPTLHLPITPFNL